MLLSRRVNGHPIIVHGISIFWVEVVETTQTASRGEVKGPTSSMLGAEPATHQDRSSLGGRQGHRVSGPTCADQFLVGNRCLECRASRGVRHADLTGGERAWDKGKS